MANYKEFLKTNRIKQVELAKYLGITEAAISNVVNGKANLSEENLIKILDNDRGWDVSMLRPDGQIVSDSVFNSNHFSYDKSGIPADQFLAVVQENQRQMGQLIDTITELAKKIQ